MRSEIAVRIDESISKKYEGESSRSANSKIGEILGRSEEAIRLWRSGAKLPDIDMLMRLADALGKPREWMVFGRTWDEALTNDPLLIRVTEEERELVNLLRIASAPAKKIILDHARSILALGNSSENITPFIPSSKTSS